MDWIVGILVPLGLAVAGIIGFLIRSWIEDLRDAERSLADDRRRIYGELLAPFINLFVDEDPGKAAADVDPRELKKVGFNFMLVASDAVARAYGDFMQHTFKLADAGESEKKNEPWETLALWARLHLEIRKSLGNRGTKLDEADMMRFTLKDMKPFEEYLKKR